MSDQIKQQIRQAYDYIKNGQRDQAHAILDSIVQTDSDNADAWWLLAMAVNTPTEMRNALQNVLRINPDHTNARQMLDKVDQQLFPAPPVSPTRPATPLVVPPEQSVTPPVAPPPVTSMPVTPSPAPPAPAAPPIPPAPTAVPPVAPAGSQMGKSIDDLFAPAPTAPPTPPAPAAVPPIAVGGSQMGESLDDLFAPSPAPTSAAPRPASPANAVDDIFSPIPFSSTPSSFGGPAAPAYSPPPFEPSMTKKGRNPVIYLLIGVGVAALCICGACVGLPLLGVGSLLANPTGQAALGTMGAIVNTGITLSQAPDRLPAETNERGTLTANKSRPGTLSTLQQDTWTYTGKRGEQVTITVTSSPRNLNPYIGLYDSDGKLLSRTPSGQARSTATLTSTLPDDGSYTILVGGLGGASGSYNITAASRSQQ